MTKSLPISHKLASAFALVILIAAAIMTFVYVTSAEVGSLTEANGKIDEEQALASEIENSLLAAVANLRGYTMSNDPADAAAFQRSIAQFDKAATALGPLLKDPKDQALLNSTVVGVGKWRTETVAPLLAHMSASEAARARELLQDEHASAGVRTLAQGAEALREEKYKDVQASLAEIDTASREEERSIVLGGLALVVAAGALWLLLRKLLGSPIVSMTGIMKRLAGGDNRVEVPDAERKDEIGDMARALLIFRDAAIAKEAADAAKAVADAEQRRVVETLTEGLGKLSEGDLTAHIGGDFPASYAVVKSNFNDALGNLRGLIGAVRDSAEAIRSGAGEIADASENLAERTQSNAASLEETNAAINQVDNRLRVSSEAATRTVARASEAIGTVNGGREVTDEAVQAMGRVSESAKGIDSVIEGLDKIAFQTRVLAMNAAVEAGRAGEAGRGFAVVADLVSALAMRAEEEAKRARDQLTVTQTDIHAAVAAVERVDGALAGICDGVGEVHALVDGMAADNAVQASAIAEINGAIGSMDRTTQQNAAMVEETSAASRSLSNEVTQLAAQAARFRVDSAAPARGTAPRSLAMMH
ncbi:HAMP domain-containing protein [Sphingomonas sp. R-74633]|uniref:methyl-accepting chemotaxis protein n=1 Tax=Sphingomonas sp. R-74633 TaxID=2751188 RepID=UPI0015D12353|nr:methyl-accepting chemotaxis protein [Sphingomonas sp. R-74633]NYT39913.1 HAMP domain-containing protein [Sphingomonas sp. R-74633]